MAIWCWAWRLQTGIDHAVQPRVALQGLGQRQGTIGLGIHAQVDGFQGPFSISQAVKGLIAPPVCFR